MKQPFFPVFHFCLQGLVIRLGVFAFLLVLILISFKNFIGFYIENYRPFCLFTMSFFFTFTNTSSICQVFANQVSFNVNRRCTHKRIPQSWCKGNGNVLDFT